MLQTKQLRAGEGSQQVNDCCSFAYHCCIVCESDSHLSVQAFEWTAMSRQRVCVSDFEDEARKVLPKAVYDYYRSGADEQNTLADNVAAFNRYNTHTHKHVEP